MHMEKSSFEDIIRNYRMNGLIPRYLTKKLMYFIRVHGNTGKTPKHALTFSGFLYSSEIMLKFTESVFLEEYLE